MVFLSLTRNMILETTQWNIFETSHFFRLTMLNSVHGENIETPNSVNLNASKFIRIRTFD